MKIYPEDFKWQLSDDEKEIWGNYFPQGFVVSEENIIQAYQNEEVRDIMYNLSYLLMEGDWDRWKELGGTSTEIGSEEEMNNLITCAKEAGWFSEEDSNGK